MNNTQVVTLNLYIKNAAWSYMTSSVARTYLPGYPPWSKGKGKNIGPTYCPSCSRGEYITKYKTRYLLGFIPIREEWEEYQEGPSPDMYVYKGAGYCSKCGHLNGYCTEPVKKIRRKKHK
ncbi:MAG: hypothetical protein Q8O88_01525 [bacterium]|nr:hypothetical protein [bacterium]